MLNYTTALDQNGRPYLKTAITGKSLLCIPALNKSTAFTDRERKAFHLLGKLPDCIETLETQVDRVYQQYLSYDKLINRNRYLNRLLDYNQTLFYALVREHIEEMLPVIYTPFVSNTVKLYNLRFMQPRGLYISYPNQDDMEQILDNRTNANVKLIVVTDGEAILGIGDQGVGGMAIPVAKLIVYSTFGGIDPNTTLPIMLDVGTNNPKILDDPLYLGWRSPRIGCEAYHAFMEKFINAVSRKFPKAFLHFEDFGRENASYYLTKYRQRLCCFNDDIQGTGIVALAAVIASGRKTGTPLTQQRIVVFGGGSAGMGVTESIYKALEQSGLSAQEARKCFWIIDRHGLLTEETETVTEAQRPFLREKTEVDAWEVSDKHSITLLDVIQHVKPTILFGCSAQAGAFTETIVHEMAQHVAHPTILPLSNPTECAEATPEDIIHWTKGRALIATGSPFSHVDYNHETYVISQCNNYLAFPGIGLGVLAAGITQLSDELLITASQALAHFAFEHCEGLLPTITQVKAASTAIAVAIAKAAIASGHATCAQDSNVEQLVENTRWSPAYLPYYLDE